MLNRLNQTLDFHGQALALRSERQRLLASNIANADTPGYVARDMNFAQALQQATGALSSLPALAVSQAGHIGGAAAGAADATLQYATTSQSNLDRNTVDMDRERASFADNSVRYEATLRFINGHVRTLTSAITGQ
ncbi:MAG: flagellar basal body rod protein FlgB [Piscinibacter sp.]|jgi:flagellar basal-body rod protein FlgB|nr:flagellar basal body rod protein FlgB [Piscinibacter sp.]